MVNEDKNISNINSVVIQRMQELNMNKTQLAQATGYTPQYITNLINGNKRWNEDVMLKVFEVLGIDIEFKMSKKRRNKT